MQKKIFLVLLIPFLLTGCASVEYNLNIDKNLGVLEEVSITATTDYFNSFHKNYPLTIVKEFYNDKDIINPLKNNHYTYELVTKDVIYPTVFAKKKYNSLTEYTNNTIFSSQSFKNVESVVKDNLVTFKTTGFFINYEDELSGIYSVSNLTINIKVPFIVTDSNADNYNPKTNTYTWVLNEDTLDKEIHLTFDKNRIYVYNLVMYISIFILCILIVGIILVVRKIIHKNKMNNRIYE